MTEPSARGNRWRRLRGWLGRRWSTGPGWTGATVAVALTALGIWSWRATEQVLPGAAAASWTILVNDPLLALAVTIVVTLLLTGVVALLRRRWPVPFLAVLVGALLLLLTMGAGASLVAWLLICGLAVVAAALMGGAAGRLIAGGANGVGRRLGGAAIVAAILTAVAAGGLVWPGPGTEAPDVVAVHDAGELPDPSARGPHEVEVTTYGSATPGPGDRYASVDVPTDPVDASDLISGWSPGGTRSSVWGFDAGELPLNATVWAPTDGGPHPLVLIVHGNSPHSGSELGFGYLAEVLASRGHVVAAIDMGFLNTSVLDRSGGIEGADRARAWLVLQHLRQWEAWQRADDQVTVPIDLDHVALVGHSRGGEAVAAAAALHAAGADPDLPGQDLTTGATIRTVVALAPSDGLIEVGGAPVTLEGVNYLTMAGSHDADVRAFAGTNQFARTEVGADTVKAAVAVHRANHSQFNSGWGRHDVGLGLAKHVLDTAALLEPVEQQQVATVFVSAFLDLTLGGDEAAAALFDGTLPEADWLPDTGFRVAAASGDQRGVTGFTDAQAPGGATVETDLGAVAIEGATATVEAVPLRAGSSDNPALHVALQQDPASVRVPVSGSLSGEDRVVVDLALAEPDDAAVTASLQVTDASGASASCPLTGTVGIPDPLPGRTLKVALLQPTATSEPALQTYAVGLACAAQAGVDLGSAEEVALVLEPTGPGTVLVDNLGVVR